MISSTILNFTLFNLRLTFSCVSKTFDAMNDHFDSPIQASRLWNTTQHLQSKLGEGVSRPLRVGSLNDEDLGAVGINEAAEPQADQDELAAFSTFDFCFSV